MDNLSENWEKKKKIKAEVEKAEQASMAESKANLANIDARTFMVGKGLSYNIGAYRTGSEKISSIALVLIVLGVIADAIIFFVATHLKMGLADLLPSMIDDAIYVLFYFSYFFSFKFHIFSIIYRFQIIFHYFS